MAANKSEFENLTKNLSENAENFKIAEENFAILAKKNENELIPLKKNAEILCEKNKTDEEANLAAKEVIYCNILCRM